MCLDSSGVPPFYGRRRGNLFRNKGAKARAFRTRWLRTRWLRTDSTSESAHQHHQGNEYDEALHDRPRLRFLHDSTRLMLPSSSSVSDSLPSSSSMMASW